jgi:hypothetical protein
MAGGIELARLGEAFDRVKGSDAGKQSHPACSRPESSCSWLRSHQAILSPIRFEFSPIRG